MTDGRDTGLFLGTGEPFSLRQEGCEGVLEGGGEEDRFEGIAIDGLAVFAPEGVHTGWGGIGIDGGIDEKRGGLHLVCSVGEEEFRGPLVAFFGERKLAGFGITLNIPRCHEKGGGG